jgi:plasmid maintenance system antidote protein VapI
MRSQPGERHGRALLTEREVLEMRSLRKCYGMTLRDLADWFGVSPATVRDICRGRRWRHVPNPPD